MEKIIKHITAISSYFWLFLTLQRWYSIHTDLYYILGNLLCSVKLPYVLGENWRERNQSTRVPESSHSVNRYLLSTWNVRATGLDLTTGDKHDRFSGASGLRWEESFSGHFQEPLSRAAPCDSPADSLDFANLSFLSLLASSANHMSG